MLVLEAIGNLGADAIIKDLNGQKYIAFSVAHTESYKDSQGQRHERTTWVSCLKSVSYTHLTLPTNSRV